mgnify:CR=1 FL=1
MGDMLMLLKNFFESVNIPYCISISFGTLTLNVAVCVYLQVFGLIKANRLDATCMKLNNYKVCEFSIIISAFQQYILVSGSVHNCRLVFMCIIYEERMRSQRLNGKKKFILSYETVMLCWSESDT